MKHPLRKPSVFSIALAIFILIPFTVKAELSDLQGHWKSACVPGEVFGQTRTDEYIINGSHQTQVTTYYGDPDCSRPIIRAEWAIELLAGGEVGTDTKELNITYNGVVVTPMSEAGSNILEAWGYCGIAEWPVNEGRDITNRAGTERCVANLPVSNYTIYSVMDDKLYLGYGFSEDASRRPADLNMDNPYTRVP